MHRYFTEAVFVRHANFFTSAKLVFLSSRKYIQKNTLVLGNVLQMNLFFRLILPKTTCCDLE